MLSTDSKGDIVYLSLTDINGNAILRDQRSDSSLFNKLYTGHHYDQVTDLTYAHARYLDTRSHSFLSVDPMYYELPSSYIYNPQSQNSYSYANNNTVVNTDPTGLWSIAGAISSASKVASAIYNYAAPKAAASLAFNVGTAVGFVTGIANGLTAIGNGALSLVYSPIQSYNTIKNKASSVSNYISNTSASTMASQAGAGISNYLSSAGSSISTAYSSPTISAGLSNGYSAGVGPAGTIASTVATIGIGVAAKGISMMGGVGEVAATENWLSKGVSTSVYIGSVNNTPKYVGITKDIAQRSSQWKGVYSIEEIASGLTRNQARSVEQSIINAQGMNFNNKINSIRYGRDVYDDAVKWGQSYLKNNGLNNWIN